MDRMKLLVSIVERGHGVAMQRLYGKYQLFLHLQCAGRGTATSEIMDILGLGSTEKDVVLTFASQAPAAALLHDLDNDLRGGVGTSGIVFSLPLSALNGCPPPSSTSRRRNGNTETEEPLWNPPRKTP